jgi:hypothetical protein
MSCNHLMQYALLSMSDVDMEEVRLGQMMALLAALTVTVLGWLFIFLLG